MYYNGRSLIRNTTLIFCGVFLFIYVFYHAAYNTLSSYVLSDTLLYLHNYLNKIWLALYPATGACVLFFVYAYEGKGAMLKGAIPLSLSWLVHSLPYFYIQSVNYGYNSGESLCLSLIISALVTVFGYASILLLTLLGLRLFGRAAGESLSDTVAQELCCPYYFNTAYPAVRTFFFISLTASLIPLCYEIYYTVSTIIDYGSSLNGTEIFLMAFNYVYIILGALLTHVVISAIRNKTVQNRISEE